MKHPRLGFKKIIPIRRQLRKEMTKSEQILWRELRAKRFGGFKFKRQHGIGPYVADFCAPREGIVVEIDGDVHALSEQKAKDIFRQKKIELLGYQVIRYSNEDILKNLEGVLKDLWGHLSKIQRFPHKTSP